MMARRTDLLQRIGETGAGLKYARAFILGMQNGLEYRADFFLNMTSAVFPIFIQIFMWSAIYEKTGEGAMFGYTYAQMIAYTVLASILYRLLRTGFEYEISEDIKSGGMDKFIIRPISHFPYRFCVFIGQKTVQTGLISLVLLSAAIIITRFTGLVIGWQQVVSFLPTFLLAYILNFILYYMVSAIAFWLSEIGFFFEAVRIVFLAMSGGIFPIEVLGGNLTKILRVLPFQYTINFPVDVLNGRITGSELLQGIAFQVMWCFILGVLSFLIWRQGSKKYVAVGG